MKKQAQHNDVRIRQAYNDALAAASKQDKPEDFFMAMYMMMTTPRESVYRVSKTDPSKTGWKVRKDSITPRYVFTDIQQTYFANVPEVEAYINQHVPKNGGCHIVSFSDAALVLHYENEKLVVMLSSAHSF